jgi:FHA domain
LGNYNYLLKCTDGIFSGKFLFINTTPDGELFGSGDPDSIDLTMYIESAELSEKHAEIKFIDNCKYVLRDCGSQGGTWVRINRDHDLYQQNRRRVYKVHDYHFIIEESKSLNILKYVGAEYFDEVGCWLMKHNFHKFIDIIRQQGVN